jgi:hypothetical protein
VAPDVAEVNDADAVLFGARRKSPLLAVGSALVGNLNALPAEELILSGMQIEPESVDRGRREQRGGSANQGSN